MPKTESCIAKKEHHTHLRDIELRQLDVTSVMLIVGLKDDPSLFLPLECRAGGKGEPVAIRYSLGWTAIGPVLVDKAVPLNAQSTTYIWKIALLCAQVV